MNKLLATSIVILGSLWCQQSYGQLFDQRRNLAIGFNGGINLSSVDFNPKIKQNTLMGNTFGFTARYMSEKYFNMMCGIQMEVNYSQRGWKEKFDDESTTTTASENTSFYSRTLNYIEIPVLAHLAFGKDSNDKGMKFFLNLGPSVSYLLSDKAKKSDDLSSATAQYQDIPKKFDYGLTGGAGLELSTKIGHFILEGRYYFGLSDIFNSSAKDTFSRSANTYYGARFSYLFDLMK